MYPHWGSLSTILTREALLRGANGEAGDVSQTIITRMLFHPPVIRGPAKPNAYLRRAVVNELTNIRRRPLTRPLDDCRKLGTKAVGPPSWLDDLLAILTCRQRRVLILVAAGYSYDEIGSICGITSGGVRASAHRARRRLRENV